MPETDSSVRLYFTYLADPTKLVDASAIAKAQAAVSKAKDPLEKLHALAALRKAQTVDTDQIVAGFVKAAPAYARANDLAPEDFTAAGVPAAVVARAFSAARRSTALSSGSVRSTRARATKQDIQDAILDLSGEFRAADVSIGSPITIRAAIEELLSQGRIVATGQGRIEGQRGRPSQWYKAK
jgi:hypothetical protein